MKTVRRVLGLLEPRGGAELAAGQETGLGLRLGSKRVRAFLQRTGDRPSQGTASNFIKRVFTSLLPPNGNSPRKQDWVLEEPLSKTSLRTQREEFPTGGEAGRGFFL